MERKRKNRILRIFAGLAAEVLLLSGCGTNVFSSEPLKKAGYTIETVTVAVDNLTKEVDLVFLSDLHIGGTGEEVDEASIGIVAARQEAFCFQGKTPNEQWKNLPGTINACHADAVLLGGDLLDFYSHENEKAFAEGLKKLKAPSVFVSADHDRVPFYAAESVTAKEAEENIHVLSGGAVSVLELAEVMIVGWDNSTDYFPAEALNTVEEAFSKGKPVVLLTHVPICPTAEDEILCAGETPEEGTLSAMSLRAWGDRVLLWGEGADYKPDDATRKFLSLVCAEDSPVILVLSGHLHFSWDGMLTETIPMHVFAEAAHGTLGVVSLVPAQ